MIRLPLYAFTTGLHLALLQFSYFFLLAINVTATYVTYATVVIAWMAGTLIGLLWPRLLAFSTMTLGVLCYYVVYFLVLDERVAPYEILVGAVGVMGAGLWAGRFFIETLPLFARADRLFFHENNGFLIGIIAVFLGFTMLGRSFLLWAPLLSGAVVLAHMAWLKVSPPPQAQEHAVTMDLAQRLEVRADVSVAAALSRWIGQFAVLMVLANLALLAAMLLQARAADVELWKLFRGEDNASTWFSSVQLILIALAAYLNYLSAGLQTRLSAGAAAARGWPWALLALGFVVFALDERFDIHELLRDVVFVPANIVVGNAWVGDGDIGLFLCFGLGCVLSVFVWPALRRASMARSLYLAAMLLALAVIVIDSLRDEVMAGWPATRFWDYTFEELGEVVAQLLFLLCFLAVLKARVRSLGVPAAATPEPPDAISAARPDVLPPRSDA